MIATLLLLAAAVTVVDGDTIRAGGERIRLLGIDAPEIHGCRQGRVCVPGDGQASKRSLEAMMGGRISVQRVGQDRYGRTLAQVYVGGRNVACEQIRRGQAQYVAKWDNGGLLAADCR
ncbi:thermonuclease family protein [Sphingobium sp. LMC3-1-1.1]|uniref:thermonuclease family protein n=1 Tax=Sphingobium sp. LMC3-1-1.1 TaxID=3135241 RepID=UPI00342BC1A0